MSAGKKAVIAIAGNPNSGKTTLFNALTGLHQRVGNWPGVTVEKKTGSLEVGDTLIEVVDLPGIYSLSSYSEDEKIARDYILSHEASLVINIVDASNLERNLFLTLNLLEMHVPVIVALNMVDLARKKGLTIDHKALSATLGVPVVPLSAINRGDVDRLKKELPALIGSTKPVALKVGYPEIVENAIGELETRFRDIALELNAAPRWLALKILEGDEHFLRQVTRLGAIKEEEITALLQGIERQLKDGADSLIASGRYEFIAAAVKECRAAAQSKRSPHGAGGALDKLVLNRFLGIPIFLLIMYLLFWVVIKVGGAFIDFFDISFGALFVDGFSRLLESIGSPSWLTAILAGGVGAGIQTVATFLPIMFMMFFMLALLEDSGYMSRAAFVMDRALRAIGLPGKAFIPMIVGFGCSVPAIMATRTLENKRDRYLTVFMVPFMSCGARLPVYALFGAAFFPNSSGLIVLSIYLVGVLLAVGTGFMLKKTLFKGESAPFIMELPPYHVPRLLDLFKHSWMRLKMFALRAGRVIILAVALLGILNSIGTDGSFGNQDQENSVLSVVGKAITPVFSPMGIDRDNWPATVGLFTGLFAKEAVVGTLTGLYGQLDAAENSERDSGPEGAAEESEPWSLGAELLAALQSIPEAFSGLAESILDPLGLSLVSGDEEAVAESVETDIGIFASMRNHFKNNSHAAYAYLLFVLIYFPCLAALGALVREVGPLFGWIAVVYLTVLAWITSTLYYQISSGGQIVWIGVALLLLAGIILFFSALKKKMILDQ
ncbi:MAG: Fe(2+) transporter permease subunit FeoB [Spirochaetia bacterium]|nr:Fe(2+) transporter permease subunit FeoB [Spirochaetia bacterium]MCE1207955.1 Fe(2+) transporter permease subunit FeoB [Spirochaetia bacterium]